MGHPGSMNINQEFANPGLVIVFHQCGDCAGGRCNPAAGHSRQSEERGLNCLFGNAQKPKDV